MSSVIGINISSRKLYTEAVDQEKPTNRATRQADKVFIRRGGNAA